MAEVIEDPSNTVAPRIEVEDLGSNSEPVEDGCTPGTEVEAAGFKMTCVENPEGRLSWTLTGKSKN